MNRTELLDDEGNELPVPPADSDVMQAIYLLEYARKRGFRVGPLLEVGTVKMQVLDTRQANAMRSENAGPSELDPDSDMALILAGQGDS